jgi:transposase
MGAPKALTATAPTLARLLDSMRKHGTAYVRHGMDAYEPQSRDRTVKHLTRRAKMFGYTLVKTSEGTPEGALA